MASMRTDRTTITAGLAAAGLLGLGLYVAVPAFAADPSSSPTPSAKPTDRGERGDWGERGEGRPFGWGRPGPRDWPGEHGARPGARLGAPLGQGVHGETTVRTRDGGFRVVTFQRGEITDVSGTALTVKSADGTAWTWTANGDTRVRRNHKDAALKDLAKGDDVRVAGERSGGTRTARLVRAHD